MDESFVEELDKSTMVIINNIKIYSETEDPEKYFRVVLEKLKWNQSYAKFEKCELWF